MLELFRLPIEKADVGHDGVYSVSLTNGPIFHGFQSIRRDIITRFIYPHSLVTIKPPYPQFIRRRSFHKQHADTLYDLNVSTAMRESLFEIFSIKKGDVILDVGSFIGYGSMRLAQIVGDSGKVIAVEADPTCGQLLEKNITSNDFKNIEIIKKAAWNENCSMSFYKKRKQENSLVNEIIESDNKITVEAVKLDDVIIELGLEKLTHVSFTINGAEPEAIQGLSSVLDLYSPSILAAGWYRRGSDFIWQILQDLLIRHNYQVIVGPVGRVYAWKSGADTYSL
jgi:FkbM family methyltransferase